MKKLQEEFNNKFSYIHQSNRFLIYDFFKKYVEQEFLKDDLKNKFSKNYRIKVKEQIDGTKKYFVQVKKLGIWFYYRNYNNFVIDYSSLESARYVINNQIEFKIKMYNSKIIKTEIIKY